MLPMSPVDAQQIKLSFANIEHPAFNATNVNVAFDVLHSGQADISIADFRIGKVHLQELTLHCAQFLLTDLALSCHEGSLQRHGRSPVIFSLDYGLSNHKLELTLRGADLSAWSALVDELQPWHPVGRFDLQLAMDRDNAKFDIELRNAGFNTTDYSLAGEGIVGKVSVSAHRASDTWQWRTDIDWSAGEAFWSPWYRKAGLHAIADGMLTDKVIRVDQARVSLEHLGSLTAGLTWNRQAAAVERWGFVTDALDLATAVKEWVQPLLDARALPGITAAGTTRYAAEWSRGELQSFYAGIEGATFKENTGRLVLRNVNASIPWSRDNETEASISVGGGQLDDFALGGFQLPLRLHGFDIATSKIAIPFLDGQLHIDDFHAARPGADWTGRFSGGIDGVSMPRITAAMSLPPMAGKFSMRVPAANYADHVLDLGGDMSIEVFDGQIKLRKLKLIEPLSHASRFVADVEARHLDLGLLTSTFSFGSILGRVDADIEGLELQSWKPIAFRARLASSPGDYRRAISRGALIDISSLGGSAGAAAVKAIPTAGFFNTFRYDNIGFGCVLKDKVCTMDGLYPEIGGYVLVEGKGIPAVKVMGYNRSIDWNLLVSRLKAVIAGNTKAVIE